MKIVPPSIKFIVYCKDGSEDDLSQEVQQYGADLVRKDTGSVVFSPHFDPKSRGNRLKGIEVSQLIFGRQLVWSYEEKHNLKRKEIVETALSVVDPILRISGINAFAGCHVETSGSESTKELTTYCKSIRETLVQKLNQKKVLPKGKGLDNLPHFHVVFSSETSIHFGWSDAQNRSPWPSGIPRLKQPANMISRSYMKLEEASYELLTERERSVLFTANSSAIDLGAAPGGWSQFLLENGLSVIAVDRAKISNEIKDHPMFKHIEENAIKFEPKYAVTLLVCDVIEKPDIILNVVTKWMQHQWCKHFVVNFKLPMKRKFEHVNKIMTHLEEVAPGGSRKWKFRCKQLYHDRDEVTFVGVSLT